MSSRSSSSPALTSPERDAPEGSSIGAPRFELGASSLRKPAAATVDRNRGRTPAGTDAHGDLEKACDR